MFHQQRCFLLRLRPWYRYRQPIVWLRHAPRRRAFWWLALHFVWQLFAWFVLCRYAVQYASQPPRAPIPPVPMSPYLTLSHVHVAMSNVWPPLHHDMNMQLLIKASSELDVFACFLFFIPLFTPFFLTWFGTVLCANTSMAYKVFPIKC